eukprot:1564494-Pyramimonas_sp.AAC.1
MEKWLASTNRALAEDLISPCSRRGRACRCLKEPRCFRLFFRGQFCSTLNFIGDSRTRASYVGGDGDLQVRPRLPEAAPQETQEIVVAQLLRRAAGISNVSLDACAAGGDLR